MWKPEARLFTVRLRWDVMQRMNVETMRGFAVTRRRGTEAGGILLGRFGSAEGPEVTIDGFETVPCDYAKGPSYLLTDNDGAAFQAAIDKYKQPGSAMNSLGFWRGHTREGMHLEPEDVALFTKSFSDPRSLALVIKPYATRPSKARFFLQENNRLGITGSAPEFPFLKPREESVAPLRTPPRPEPPPLVEAPPPPPLPLPVVPAQPVARIPEPKSPPPALPAFLAPKPERTNTARHWLVWVVMAATAGALGGYQYGISSGTPALKPPAVAALAAPMDPQLNVQQKNDLVTINWNPQAASVEQAQRAVLNIEDAGVRHQEMITKFQLRQGLTTYQPIGELVKFRMEFVYNNDLTLESNVSWSRAAAPANP